MKELGSLGEAARRGRGSHSRVRCWLLVNLSSASGCSWESSRKKLFKSDDGWVWWSGSVVIHPSHTQLLSSSWTYLEPHCFPQALSPVLLFYSVSCDPVDPLLLLSSMNPGPRRSQSSSPGTSGLVKVACRVRWSSKES